MDRRTLLFFVISVMILILWQEFFAPPPPPLEPQSTATETVQREARSRVADEFAKDPRTADGRPYSQELLNPGTPKTAPEGKIIRVETDLYIAEFTTAGARLKNFQLKEYRETSDPDSPFLSMIRTAPEIELPLGLELRGSQSWRDTDALYQANRQSLSLAGDDVGSIEMRTTAFDGEPIVKQFTFRGNRYPIELLIDTPATNQLPIPLSQATPEGQPANVALLLTQAAPKMSDGYFFEGPSALVDGDIVQTNFGDLEAPEVARGTVEWAGFQDHYFLLAAAPERAVGVRFLPEGNKSVEQKILTPRAASGPTNLAFTLYVGPKDRSTLQAAGHQLERGLDMGWFAPIALILLSVLEFLHRYSSNWGVDIILLTVIVKVIFFPLTRKSFASMRDMQKLQPEMTKIREKYKDDSQKMNEQVMELYKRHGVNPLGSCLPMILQIPVFIGLYQLLQNTIQLRHAPFAFWITDLAAPERLNVLPFSLPWIGNGIPVLTILLGASMYLQQKLSPQAGDPMQQRIMMLMPLIFTVMFVSFPAGLTIYWLTNNLITIAQQWWMLRGAPATPPKPAT